MGLPILIALRVDETLQGMCSDREPAKHVAAAVAERGKVRLA
jgi:hypothetical protein